MDMHFKWLLNSEQQGQFKIYWKPGKSNLVDYFTKQHPLSHHLNVRGEFLMIVAELQQLHLHQPTKLTGLVMTVKILFPTFSTRVY